MKNKTTGLILMLVFGLMSTVDYIRFLSTYDVTTTFLSWLGTGIMVGVFLIGLLFLMKGD